MNLSLENIVNLPPEKKVDHYCFNYQAILGKGSFSNVFAGFDEDNGNIVAIKTINKKVLDDYLYKALQAEIEIMKKLNHQNLVRLHNLVNTVNNVYVITEYCNGGDLSSLLSLKKRLPEPEALLVMSDILKGLKELIKHKIIHRDLKPANIFINDGVFKIGDFGFAKQFRENNERSMNPIVGSPYYMPPKYLEQGTFTITHDIWSLGVMFYEILYGEIPWPSQDRIQLVKNIYSKPLYFPKHVDVSMQTQRFISRCLKINENDRITWEEIFKSDLFFLGSGKENFIKKPSFTFKNDQLELEKRPNVERFSKNPSFIKENEDHLTEAENSKKETTSGDSDVDKKILENNDDFLNRIFNFDDDPPKNLIQNKIPLTFNKIKNTFLYNEKKLESVFYYIEFLNHMRFLIESSHQRKFMISLEKVYFLILKQWAILSCFLSEIESANILNFDDWENFKNAKSFHSLVAKIQLTNDNVFTMFTELSSSKPFEDLAKKDNMFGKIFHSDLMNESKEFSLISDYFIVTSIKEVNDFLRNIVNLGSKSPFKEDVKNLVRILAGLIEYHNILNIFPQNDENNDYDPFAVNLVIKTIDFSKIFKEIKEKEVDWTYYLGLKLKVHEINP